MENPKDKKPASYNFRQLMGKEPIDESVLDIDSTIGQNRDLNFSDYYDSSIPNEEKPPMMFTPMQEMDWPIQTKNLFAGLFEDEPKSSLQMSPLIKETDNVDYNGANYDWDNDDVSVMVLFELNGKLTWAASVFRGDIDGGFYSNNKRVAAAMNNFSTTDDITTHGDLLSMLDDVVKEEVGSAFIQGRLFQIQDPKYQYIMGFWEPKAVVTGYKDLIFDYLKTLKIDPTTILWTYDDGYKVVTFNQMFNSNKKSKGRSKQQLELLKQIHLNAALKKKVLQLPPHPFQLLADKLGVTVAQLRQLAGSMDEVKKPELTSEQIMEAFSKGDGFWLSPKGTFHNVDIELGAHGHLDWARRKFKRALSYEEMFELGYVWVGVMEDASSIFFMYGTYPSSTQMYLLKKTAADEGLKLHDMKEKKDVDIGILQELNRLDESDQVQWQNNVYGYWNRGASVFLLYPNGIWVSSTFRGPLPDGYMSSDDNIENKLNDPNAYDVPSEVDLEGGEYPYNHPDLKDILQSADVGFDPFNKDILDGRLFYSPGAPTAYIMGFWEDRKDVQANKKYVFDYLERLGIDPHKIMWSDNGGSDKNRDAEPYEQFFGTESKDSLTPEQRALMKLQHLNSIAKRKLLKLPPTKLEKLADSMGITVVQLRQMLGGMDEEMVK